MVIQRWGIVKGHVQLQSSISRSYDMCNTRITGKNGTSGKHNGNTSIWHFDLLEIVWHQTQASIVTLMELSCVVLWQAVSSK